MSSFGTVWKLNPGFWSSWLTWRQSKTMKGGSREAKGHKTTGGGRTWYGKRGDSDAPVPPPPPTKVVPWFWFIFKYNLLHRHINSRIMAVTMDSKQEKLQENVILTFKNLKVTWRLVAMRFFYLFWQGKIHFQVLTAEKRCMFWSGLSKR